MNACPIMLKDSGRNLLARLVCVYSDAITANDNHTLSSRLQMTPSVPYGVRILGASLCTRKFPHHKIIDPSAKRVA